MKRSSHTGCVYAKINCSVECKAAICYLSLESHSLKMEFFRVLAKDIAGIHVIVKRSTRGKCGWPLLS
jgi:hypothetical protein